jgi:hypothetical protein
MERENILQARGSLKLRGSQILHFKSISYPQVPFPTGSGSFRVGFTLSARLTFGEIWAIYTMTASVFPEEFTFRTVRELRVGRRDLFVWLLVISIKAWVVELGGGCKWILRPSPIGVWGRKIGRPAPNLIDMKVSGIEFSHVEKLCDALIRIEFPEIIFSCLRGKETISRYSMSIAVRHMQNQGKMIKYQRLSDYDKSTIVSAFCVSICN